MTSPAPSSGDQFIVALLHPDRSRSGQLRTLLAGQGYRVVPTGLAGRVDVVVSAAGDSTSGDVPQLILVPPGAQMAPATTGFAPSEVMVDDPAADQELALRVAVLCRQGRRASETLGGALSLDDDRRVASTSAGAVTLTAIEHRLLRALAARVDQIAARRALVALVWPRGSRVARNTLDSHIRRLRAKLASIGSPVRIETIHGSGFRLILVPG